MMEATIILLVFITFVVFLFVSFIIYAKSCNETYTDKGEIIVSLTTSPMRISKIEPVINSIMNQTIVPNKIVLNLPHVFKRNNSTFSFIPTFLVDNKIVVINRCEDIGPITKVLPTVQIAKNMDDIIISIDDDINYPPDMIETLLEVSKKNPDSVIAACADHEYKENTYALAAGYCGILYKKKFLVDFDIDKIKDFPRACYLGDDLIISNYLAKKNINVIGVLSQQKKIWAENRILSFGNESDALHLSHENATYGGHDYKTCINYLKDNNDYHMNSGFESTMQ